MEEKILKASATGYRPAVARLTTNHINGGVSFICDSLAGWSSKCSFVVYEVDSDGVPIAGTETDWIGSKVNNNLESLTLTAGTDRDYPANLTMVVADETAGGRNKLVDALTTTLEVDGTLKSSIVTEAKIATDAVSTAKIKDLNVTATKLATDAVETAKIKNGAVTPDKLATDVTTDANGWTVINHGSYKQYIKRYIWTGSQSIGANELLFLGNVFLPVGKTTANLIINYTSRASDRIFLINTRINSDAESNVGIEANNFFTSAATLTKAWVDFVCFDKI